MNAGTRDSHASGVRLFLGQLLRFLEKSIETACEVRQPDDVPELVSVGNAKSVDHLLHLIALQGRPESGHRFARGAVEELIVLLEYLVHVRTLVEEQAHVDIVVEMIDR